MTTENAVETNVIVSEPLDDSTGYCTECHSITFFMVDKKLGYYKHCPNCGNIQYLHRRFLRFDRRSRQWK
ncbi:MAG TPA: hypothetical protein VMW86_09525 [Dehalococcoidales bacterium]|nr:hypothetical protein [Dehalococcoidales bacterium]